MILYVFFFCQSVDLNDREHCIWGDGDDKTNCAFLDGP